MQARRGCELQGVTVWPFVPAVIADHVCRDDGEKSFLQKNLEGIRGGFKDDLLPTPALKEKSFASSIDVWN